MVELLYDLEFGTLISLFGLVLTVLGWYLNVRLSNYYGLKSELYKLRAASSFEICNQISILKKRMIFYSQSLNAIKLVYNEKIELEKTFEYLKQEHEEYFRNVDLDSTWIDSLMKNGLFQGFDEILDASYEIHYNCSKNILDTFTIVLDKVDRSDIVYDEIQFCQQMIREYGIILIGVQTALQESLKLGIEPVFKHAGEVMKGVTVTYEKKSKIFFFPHIEWKQWIRFGLVIPEDSAISNWKNKKQSITNV